MASNGAYSQLLCFLFEFAVDMRRTQQELDQVGGWDEIPSPLPETLGIAVGVSGHDHGQFFFKGMSSSASDAPGKSLSRSSLVRTT